MLRYELVIFDFDGTLADSADVAISELKAASQRFGIRAVSDEEIAMLRGRTSQEITRYLGIPLWKIPRIMAHMRERMTANADRIRLFPGVSEIFAALSTAGVRLAIVSSNTEANVRKILGADNAARIEHFACGASMFGKGRRFRSVIRRAGVDASKTLCIGDETRDIEAARDARAHSAAVAWGYAKVDVLVRQAPTLVLETMASVVRAVVVAPAGA